MSEPHRGPRRFYSSSSVEARGEAFVVMLDGAALRTPAKAVFAAPTRALADACAQEWRDQTDFIRPALMPMTRLVNVTLDVTRARRAEIEASIARYGESDLLCHRARAPAPLVARETLILDPILMWSERRLGARFAKTVEINGPRQDPEALAALARTLKELDEWALTGVGHGAGLARSALLALALREGAVTVPSAYAAATLEEQHQLETWGHDGEAQARLDLLRSEFEALAAFFAALK